MIPRLIKSMLAAIATTVAISGCSLINEDSDCVLSSNLVKFRYDYNMKHADAFSSEVKQVTLLAFESKTGRLVQRLDVPADKMRDGNSIPLEVEPGAYDLLAWAGEHSKSFDIAAGKIGESTIADFHAYLHRTIADDGTHNVSDDIAPLFHGMMHVNLSYASPSAPNIVEMPLVKDTNVIRVILQHVTGEMVDHSNFTFTISDRNGWLNADNSLRDNQSISYHPWRLYTGTVDINTNPTDAPTNRATADIDSRSLLGGSMAEFTLSRLMMQNDPELLVTDKSGKTILKINIRDYALLVKGFYNESMDDQEYLDRQDEYNMTFFLDEGNRWLNAVIVINDWRIVRHSLPLE